MARRRFTQMAPSFDAEGHGSHRRSTPSARSGGPTIDDAGTPNTTRSGGIR